MKKSGKIIFVYFTFLKLNLLLVFIREFNFDFYFPSKITSFELCHNFKVFVSLHYDFVLNYYLGTNIHLVPSAFYSRSTSPLISNTTSVFLFWHLYYLLIK